MRYPAVPVSGWLLTPAHPRLLLQLGVLSWLCPTPLPSRALGCVWKGQGGQWLCLQPERALCLTPTPSPSTQENSLPSLGPNAAGPACNHTVHVEVVGVIPSTVFCADLENNNRLQLDSHSFACWLGKIKTAPWEEARSQTQLPLTAGWCLILHLPEHQLTPPLLSPSARG